MRNYVSASILSADLLNLESEVRKLEKSGADMIHFDVMDGIFVNNITYGIPVLKKIREITHLELDVHLMITDPIKYVFRFADAGADIITFHLESSGYVMNTIKAIRSTNAKAAIALKPDTPAEKVFEYMPYVDMILIMTVEPGFGGQQFMDDMLKKVEAVKKYADENNIDTDIQVDGGIDDKTGNLAKKAGANILVSGSYLFKSGNLAETVNLLRKESE